MVEFEVIDIKEKVNSFTAEIELKDRTRRKFGYPKGEGWEVEMGKQPKFIHDIGEKLKRESLISTEDSSEFESMKEKLLKKKIKL